MPISHRPLFVKIAGLRTWGEVARSALAAFSLSKTLGYSVTSADVDVFVISQDESHRLVADVAHVVPVKMKGFSKNARNTFNAGELCLGSSLLLELNSKFALNNFTKQSRLNGPDIYKKPLLSLEKKKTENSEMLAPSKKHTLSFLVCNGFANQRLSILYGILLAHLTNRDVILPDLEPDGTQLIDGDADYVDKVPEKNNVLKFDNVFDINIFTSVLERFSIKVILPATISPDFVTKLSLSKTSAGEEMIFNLFDREHISVDCPLWRVSSSIVSKYESFLLEVLGALVPASKYQKIVDGIINQISNSGTDLFDAVHLRFEEDWYRHCARWSFSTSHSNCGLLTPNDLAEKILALGLNRDSTIYIAVQEDRLRNPAVLEILRKKFKVITRLDLLPLNAMPWFLTREEAALIDYFVCLKSRTFIGNSVSTFSALVIMERRLSGKIATWYNGGNIPLENKMPFFRFPWVFTYNDL